MVDLIGKWMDGLYAKHHPAAFHKYQVVTSVPEAPTKVQTFGYKALSGGYP